MHKPRANPARGKSTVSCALLYPRASVKTAYTPPARPCFAGGGLGRGGVVLARFVRSVVRFARFARQDLVKGIVKIAICRKVPR